MSVLEINVVAVAIGKAAGKVIEFTLLCTSSSVNLFFNIIFAVRRYAMHKRDIHSYAIYRMVLFTMTLSDL